MNASNPNPSLVTFASTALIVACAMLAACDQVVTSAHAQSKSLSVSVAPTNVAYFGEQYAAEQMALVADSKPQAPTF
jgi:hypothetical protein